MEFYPDGALKTPTSRALEAVSPFDRETGLPKRDPFRDALDAVSPIDFRTGLPKR